jgi:PAS domain S-box-containing protein
MRAENWSDGALGPPETWAQPLRTAIEMALYCPRPMLVVWGHDYIGFPNDAFEGLLQPGESAPLGGPYLSRCATLSPALAEALAAAYAGESASVGVESRAGGGPFEMFCAPLRHPNGAVGGAFCLALLERRTAQGGRRREEAGTAQNVEPEHALARRAGRLQAALDAASIGTWEWQPASDVMTLDARSREILGHGVAPASASALERAVHGQDLERRRAAIAALGVGERPRRFSIEFRWRREDGRYVWLEQTGEARIEETGFGVPTTIVSGTLRDVTERKANDEALRAASEHKDRFLAALAHELRNPLAPLRYAAELLGSAGREDLEWSRDVIERQVSHLARLIDDLFDISRLTHEVMGIEKRRIELTQVVQAALDTCRPSIVQNRQQLIVHLPSESIYVLGDAVRLTQVIVNLIKNASKFTGRDGRIRVTAARRGGECAVEVEDSGVGIRSEDLPHVFDAFFRGQPDEARVQSGLGIGLYLAKRLVELHGGRIEAGSGGPGTGSRFAVRLPLLEPRESAGAARAKSAVKRSAGPSSCRILVVDDDPDSADSLARLLRLMGGEVETAYDGLAAVVAAEQFHPHVVLLDLEMPRLDGYEACRRLRRQSWAAGARMVALTGWGRREDRARTKESGFDSHLVKPVGRADVEALLRDWRQSKLSGRVR